MKSVRRARRGAFDSGWTWEDVPLPRSRSAIATFAVAAIVAALSVFLLTSPGGNDGQPQSCGDATLDVTGQLTGVVDWCGPEGSVVTDLVGVVAVHYPSNANPCGFTEEPGPGGGWFELPGTYALVLEGPPLPAATSSANWTYSFTGSFASCGGENSMRVTIVAITNLQGSTAWSNYFGPGAYGDRTASFKPAGIPTPTPTSSPTPPPTASPTPTGSPPSSPTPSPSPTSPPTASPTPTTPASATPSPTPSSSPTTPPTASPTPSPSPSPTLATSSPTLSPTPSPSPTSATPSPSPTVLGPEVLPPTGSSPGSQAATAGLVLLLGPAFLLAAGWLLRRALKKS